MVTSGVDFEPVTDGVLVDDDDAQLVPSFLVLEQGFCEVAPRTVRIVVVGPIVTEALIGLLRPLEYITDKLSSGSAHRIIQRSRHRLSGLERAKRKAPLGDLGLFDEAT